MFLLRARPVLHTHFVRSGLLMLKSLHQRASKISLTHLVGRWVRQKRGALRQLAVTSSTHLCDDVSMRDNLTHNAFLHTGAGVWFYVRQTRSTTN